jgi:hypothetical protein
VKAVERLEGETIGTAGTLGTFEKWPPHGLRVRAFSFTDRFLPEKSDF